MYQYYVGITVSGYVQNKLNVTYDKFTVVAYFHLIMKVTTSVLDIFRIRLQLYLVMGIHVQH